MGIELAASAIISGVCNTVVVAFGDNRRTGYENRLQVLVNMTYWGGSERDTDYPYGHTIPSAFA